MANSFDSVDREKLHKVLDELNKGIKAREDLSNADKFNHRAPSQTYAFRHIMEVLVKFDERLSTLEAGNK